MRFCVLGTTYTKASKAYKFEHTCFRAYRNKQADKYWMRKKLEKRLSSQPLLKHEEAIDHMMENYNVHLDEKKNL